MSNQYDMSTHMPSVAYRLLGHEVRKMYLNGAPWRSFYEIFDPVSVFGISDTAGGDKNPLFSSHIIS